VSAAVESDVVVVGAGAAGCVVAARLAETGDRSVMLLEAGPDRRRVVPAPLRDGWRLARGADWPDDWGFTAEVGATGAEEPIRRGRLIGGTSWLTRFAVRGAAADFDAWGATVDPSWSFEHLLPAFRRLERDADFGSEPWHGDAGPMPITRYRDQASTAIHAAAVEAILASGIPPVDDHNRPGALGVGRVPMSTRDGLRVTTADAYLPMDGSPRSLTIRADAPVARVVLDGTRAVGVELVDGTLVNADEVVLCAGTYGSPTILLRSGIGPAADLAAVGVVTRVDMPGVGANLADHIGVDVPLGWRGSARRAPILHSIATFKSRTATGDVPDLMFWIADPEGEDAEATMDAVLLKPRSRGSVRLRSADPAIPPRIELPRVREAQDVDGLADAYQRGVDIAHATALRAIATHPAPRSVGLAAARRIVLDGAYSIPHVVGTCAMGRNDADGAVVDARGRVYGVEGLRIVDASIMPDAPAGFPHLITIMIAERLAEDFGA
jgi:choline dehydrogenase-like flavoprotein